MVQQNDGNRTVLDVDRQREGGIPAGELLEGDQVGREIEFQPAIALRHHHPQKAQPGQFVENVAIECPLVIPLPRHGYDLAVGEIARELLDGPLIPGKHAQGDSSYG